MLVQSRKASESCAGLVLAHRDAGRSTALQQAVCLQTSAAKSSNEAAYLNVELLANLLWCLALDLIRDSGASDVQQGGNVEEVCRQDEIKQGGVVNVHEIFVELLDLHPTECLV
jgi:hypothetical protein